MSYLKNSFCKFTQITKINIAKKKNIISVSLFKMRSGGYKDFSKYLDGIKLLTEIAKGENNMEVRLFIDRSVHEDKQIMNYLLDLDNVSIVRYECPNFIVDGFHVSTFGSIVRFFPMFDFENNDAMRVIVMDAEPTKELIDLSLELYRNIIKYKIIDEYIAFGGRYNHNNAKKIVPVEHNGKTYIVPYCTASRIIGIKRIPPEMITTFLELLTTYVSADTPPEKKLYEYPISKDDIAKKCEKNICYGVDEYYLNKSLFDSLIKHDCAFCFQYNFDMANFYYFTHPKNAKNISMSKPEYKKLFDSYMKYANLDKYSYHEIDKQIFVERSKEKHSTATTFMRKFGKNMSKLLEKLYKDKDYRVFGIEKIYDYVSADHEKYFYAKCIKFINSQRKDIILESIKY